jgi:hypothetical protein
MNHDYDSLMNRLKVSDGDYTFVPSFDEKGVFHIKYSGPLINKSKRIGSFRIAREHFDHYSDLFGSAASLSNIMVFESHRGNGHCTNTLGLIVDLLSGVYDKLVIVNVNDKGGWASIVDKLGISGNCSFQSNCDVFDDLVIDLPKDTW